MQPQSLTDPLDLPGFVRLLHASYGGVLDHPAWDWTVPGSPEPGRPPWEDQPPEVSG
jgi:hypothetical protein